jgi:hypothetical protein
MENRFSLKEYNNNSGLPTLYLLYDSKKERLHRYGDLIQAFKSKEKAEKMITKLNLAEFDITDEENPVFDENIGLPDLLIKLEILKKLLETEISTFVDLSPLVDYFSQGEKEQIGESGDPYYKIWWISKEKSNKMMGRN